MSSLSIFDLVTNFTMEFNTCLVAHPTKELKKNKETDKNIIEIYQTAQDSIKNWTERSEGFYEKFKQACRNLLLKAPKSNWVGKKICNLANRISLTPKVPALIPYEFDKLDQAEKNRAILLKTVATVLLVAGTILLTGGIALPLALAPLLVLVAESVAIAVIAGCTIAGIVAVPILLGHPFIHSTKLVREYEANEDPDFQRFVKQEISNFKLSRKDIQNGELYDIYKVWKEALKTQLCEQQLLDLEMEREKVGT